MGRSFLWPLKCVGVVEHLSSQEEEALKLSQKSRYRLRTEEFWISYLALQSLFECELKVQVFLVRLGVEVAAHYLLI